MQVNKSKQQACKQPSRKIKAQHVDGICLQLTNRAHYQKKTVAAALNRLQLIKPLIVSEEFLVAACTGSSKHPAFNLPPFMMSRPT